MNCKPITARNKIYRINKKQTGGGEAGEVVFILFQDHNLDYNKDNYKY
jgi:hypothetical protein